MPDTRLFEAVSAAIPVINETSSLEQVVSTLAEEAGPDILEFLLVVCERTTRESLAVCEKLRARYPDKLSVMFQKKLPHMGGAIREAFEIVRGSHVVVVFADAESDPHTVKGMIEKARQFPDAVISASRWIEGGKFEGYAPFKKMINYLGQILLSLLYGPRLTDYTFGYKLYSCALVRSIRWEELRNSFSLETTLKPLRLGVPFIEVPTVWRPRREGESQFPLYRYWRFAWIAVKIRFCPKRLLLK
jgi:hypothetical protein